MMKKASKKSASRSSDTPEVFLAAGRLDTLESRILACLEKMHRLEKENAELLLQLQERKYKPLEAQEQLEKTLREKEQTLKRQQTLIRENDDALKQTQAELSQWKKTCDVLNEQNRQLNGEIQALKIMMNPLPAQTEAAVRDPQTTKQLRRRIEQAMEKVEQLERLFLQP